VSTPAKPFLYKSGKKRSNQIVGHLAEALVANWLMQQGGEILQRRWHCRWGELDIVAHIDLDRSILRDQGIFSQNGLNRNTANPTIAFVEVKARCGDNWDMDGRLAITPQKQQKLWKAAELFLADYPHLTDFVCRFDVALVRVQARTSPMVPNQSDTAKHSDRSLADKKLPPLDEFVFDSPIQLGQFVSVANYNLCLQHYIESAFDLT